MGDGKDRGEESPATWENVVVGEIKEFVGRATGDEELEQEGEDQSEVAHEVRDEYEDEKKHDRDD